MGRRLRALTFATVAVVVVAGLLFAVTWPLPARALLQSFASAAGYRLRLGTFGLSWREARAEDLELDTRSGETVLRAATAVVDFNLRDLLPGGRRLFGLTALRLERPSVWIVHRRDGTWNVPIPSGGASPGTAGLPLDADLSVRDGSVDLRDQTRVFADARHFVIRNIELEAHIHLQERSHYTASAVAVVGGRSSAVRGHGILDERRGYESHRVTVGALNLAPLVNYLVDSPSLHVLSGTVTGLDARAWGLMGASGAMDRRLAARGRLRGVAILLGGLEKPVANITGDFSATETHLTAGALTATLAGVPLHIAGGLFDFRAPKLEIGVRGAGPLADFASVSPAAARLPLRGRLRLGLRVEGLATDPLLLARVRGFQTYYAGFPLDDVSVLAALQGTTAALFDAHLRYVRSAADARGTVRLGKEIRPELSASLVVPPGGIPFAAALAPGLPARATALVSGPASRLSIAGLLEGATPQVRVAGTFAIDGSGAGRAGPLSADFADGRFLYVRARLGGFGRSAGVVVLAHDLHVAPVERPKLPGLNLPALPRLSADVDGALAGQLRGTTAEFGAFSLRVRSAHIANVVVGVAAAEGVARDGTLGLSRLSVDGPWGKLSAVGTATAGAIALLGRFRGDLAAAGAQAGVPGLRGSADLPLRLFADRRGVVAQVDRGRFAGGSVRGVALSGVSATAAVHGSTVDLYSALTDASGGRIVARGQLGGGGELDVATRDLPMPPLAAPLRGGRLTALARVHGSAQAPRVDGAVVLADASVRGLPVAGSAGLNATPHDVALRDATALAAAAVITADGSAHVSAVPRYQLQAAVRGASLATLARASGQKLPVPLVGAADADVRIAGAGAELALRGHISADGSVNGLHFTEAGADVRGSRAGTTVHDGSVTVGSTRIALSGTFAAGAQSAFVRAPHLDLADFNDFFDPGDMLAGRGSLTANLRASSAALESSGNVRLAGARLRRYAVGNAAVEWATRGRAVTARGTAASPAGTVAFHGSALLPQRDPLVRPASRLRLTIDARAHDVDLATWLPAAELYLPVSGRLDADVAGSGTLRAPTGNVRAVVRGGTVGHLPLERASLEGTIAAGRVTVTQAALAVPALTVSGNGSFGLSASAPLALTADASSPDLAALAKSFTGRTVAVGGSLTANVRGGGSLARPGLSATLDVTAARYEALTVPRIHAAASLDNGMASLDDAEIALPLGRIVASGRVPFDIRAPQIRPNGPITGNLSVVGVELAGLGPLLPKGTALRGALNGDLSAAGTLHLPQVRGSLALTGAAYSSPLLVSGISNARATIRVDGGRITVDDAHAQLGSGSVDAVAVANVPDFSDPIRTLVLQTSVRASRAQVDAPAYIRGTFDGNVTVSKAAGAPLTLAGSVSVPTARIPLSALYNPAPAKGTPAPPPPVAFDLSVNAGRDVRIQSGQIDIGGEGAVHVGGTLAAPMLSGTIRSTGGSIDFYRTFQIDRATVRFSPSDGVLPTVYAVATTSVPDPATDVTLTVSGLAPNNLDVQLASDPVYGRAQILGLLLGAQNLGAVSGVATTSGATPGAGQLAQSLASGALSQQFTRQLLEPLSAHLGEALGLRQLAIGYNPSGGFSANARTGIARNVDAVYAETFSYPVRQSLGIEAHPSPGTSLQLTFFQQQGTGQFSPALYATSSNPALTAAQPAAGTSGFSFVVQHRFFGGKRKAPTPHSSPAPPEAAAR